MTGENSSAVTIVGDAGRATTRRMLEAIATSRSLRFPETALLLSRGFSAENPPRAWNEVLAGLGANAIAVVPADELRVASLAGLSGAKVVTFGYDALAELRVVDVRPAGQTTDFGLEVAGERYDVTLRLIGEHFVYDAAAALAAAWGAGILVSDAVAAIETITEVGTARMQPVPAASGVLLIDDSASMTPVSTVAALKALATLGTEGHRTVAVLGALDLPESASSTGFSADEEASREAHDRIGRIVVRLNIRLLIVIGHAARHLHNAAGLEGSWNGESVLVGSADEALEVMRKQMKAGDAMLVKYQEAGAPSLAGRLAALELTS